MICFIYFQDTFYKKLHYDTRGGSLSNIFMQAHHPLFYFDYIKKYVIILMYQQPSMPQ